MSNDFHAINFISVSITNFFKFSQAQVWIFKLKTMKNRQKLNDFFFEIKT